ncbi:hypothetical protein [Oleiagrimonas sp. C23AA]|uniref:ATP-grasp domain-containing protein n=1 Tax=Oleiagrimonas sp. C23AA TaxID=2719047 RepID=UPI001423A026|nr:hypothetical protein [Oleiagrimonas sp. C23AA]NII11793.1 hypothetical protein [Oleiagrimonas sp. C23AA]
MTQPVIFFSEKFDPHASALEWVLRKSDVPTIVSADIMNIYPRLSIEVDSSHQLLRAGKKHTKELDARSIWFRRPQRPNLVNGYEPDREFMEKQWSIFQKNIFDLSCKISPALWVNRPSSAAKAESKLVQLHAARELAIPFPETLVSNHSEDVASMIKSYGRVVHKVFHPHTWQTKKGDKCRSASVSILDEHSDLPDASIAMCPGIFQRYIVKSKDIRVTVIGKRMFAVAISRAVGDPHVDPREHMNDSDVIMDLIDLPLVWENRIKCLMNRLGLIFGCVDLVVDRSGRIYFLEVNQAGQFLFIEDRLKRVPLLRSMAALLISGRVDYELDVCRNLSLSDYDSSGEYQAASNYNFSKLPNVSYE